MFIVFDLSPEAIDSLDKLVEESGITRSDFIERSITLLDTTNSALPIRPVPHKEADEAQLDLDEDMQRTISRYEQIENALIKAETQWLCSCCGQKHSGQVSFDSEKNLDSFLACCSNQQGAQVLSIWRVEDGIR